MNYTQENGYWLQKLEKNVRMERTAFVINKKKNIILFDLTAFAKLYGFEIQSFRQKLNFFETGILLSR